MILFIVPDVVGGVINLRRKNQEDSVRREAILGSPDHRGKVYADFGSAKPHFLPPRAVVDDEGQFAFQADQELVKRSMCMLASYVALAGGSGSLPPAVTVTRFARNSGTPAGSSG